MKQFRIGLLIFVAISSSLIAQVTSPDITPAELEQHVSFLASNDLQGRLPGTVGDKKAAEYILKSLLNAGLQPMGEDGFQYFNLITSVSAGENNQFSFEGFNGKMGEDFTPLSFSKNGTCNAEVAFAGYGFQISDDSLKWDDYTGIDVTDKWVMLLLGDPTQQNPASIFVGHSGHRKKVLVAKDQGAAGIIFVSGPVNDADDALSDLYYDKMQKDAGLPVIHIKRAVADQLIKDSGQTIDALEKRLNDTRQPASFLINQNVQTETEIHKVETTTQNVIAMLPGNDPILKDEYIVLGAHYDHLGLGGPGSGSRTPDTTAVHNGADDNASGVASVMEIAEKLGSQKNNKRSIIFMAFGAEEMGIVGSKYFAENPLVDLGQVQLMLNLDMVGRLDSLEKSISISGTGTSPDFADLSIQLTEAAGLSAQLSPEGLGPSDHASFYVKDVPVLSFMTGIHTDYHTPEDDVDKLNFEGQKTVSDLIYEFVVSMDSRTDRLVFQESGPKVRRSMGRRFKVTLGIMPDIAASDIKGLRASAVTPGKPASRAGMEKGDIIVAIDGKPINDIYEYMHRLGELKSGQITTVEVLRAGEKKVLIVQL